MEVTEDLPSPQILNRWKGEPLKALIIPSSVFISNKQGFPVLSARHKDFVTSLFKVFILLCISYLFTLQYKVHLILKGKPALKKEWKPYVQYIHFLYGNYPPFSQEDQIEIPYYDYLQAPLQVFI